MRMKLWLIKQSCGFEYDTYDSAVVVAPNENAARHVVVGNRDTGWDYAAIVNGFTCEYLGRAKKGSKAGVILASFNAA